MVAQKKSLALAAIGISCCCTNLSFAATLLFDQPLLNQTDRGAFSWWNGQELADQFKLTESAVVTGLSWFGTFWQTDLAPGETQYPFVIRFFDTAPASQYAVQTLGDPTTATSVPFYEISVLANATPSGVPFVGTDGGLDAPDRITYEFSIDNISGPALTQSTEYWISILGGEPATWRWANSTVTSSDYAVYRFVYLNETNWSGFSNASSNLPVGENRGNSAFTLNGTEIPELSPVNTIVAGLTAIFCGLKVRQRGRKCLNSPRYSASLERI